MSIAALLSAIRESKGPVTGIELAQRLGISPGTVAQMLAALRASGQLAPEMRTEPALETCASSGTCSMSCPGPEDCSLVIDLSVTGLQVRPATRAAR